MIVLKQFYEVGTVMFNVRSVISDKLQVVEYRRKSLCDNIFDFFQFFRILFEAPVLPDGGRWRLLDLAKYEKIFFNISHGFILSEKVTWLNKINVIIITFNSLKLFFLFKSKH